MANTGMNVCVLVFILEFTVKVSTSFARLNNLIWTVTSERSENFPLFRLCNKGNNSSNTKLVYLQLCLFKKQFSDDLTSTMQQFPISRGPLTFALKTTNRILPYWGEDLVTIEPHFILLQWKVALHELWSNLLNFQLLSDLQFVTTNHARMVESVRWTLKTQNISSVIVLLTTLEICVNMVNWVWIRVLK